MLQMYIKNNWLLLEKNIKLQLARNKIANEWKYVESL